MPGTVILALRQYPQGGAYNQGNTTNSIPLSLDETFAKLSETAIMCLDSQSAKFDFPIDSRLRGNDGRFCKGLLDGEESKARVKTRQTNRQNPPLP